MGPSINLDLQDILALPEALPCEPLPPVPASSSMFPAPGPADFVLPEPVFPPLPPAVLPQVPQRALQKPWNTWVRNRVLQNSPLPLKAPYFEPLLVTQISSAPPDVPETAHPVVQSFPSSFQQRLRVNVLYVFAGAHRKSDVGDQLRTMQLEFGFDMDIREVDLLRSTTDDVTITSFWEGLLNDLRTGLYDCLVITPPCNTHSRARNAASPGPRPLRSKKFPWGFPWLTGKLLEECEMANGFIRQTLEACHIAHLHNVSFLVEHPEDLGSTPAGDQPASIWSLHEMFELAVSTKASTVALHQCHLGAASSKPTRLLSTLDLNNPNLGPPLSRGWPQFSNAGFYKGPLPRHCGHRHKPLLGRSGPSGKFRTSAAAAYPPAMNCWIAQMIIRWCLSVRQPKGGASILPAPSVTREVSPPTSRPPPPLVLDSPQKERLPHIKSMEPIEADDITSSEEDQGVPRPLLKNHRGGYGLPLSSKWAGKSRELHDGAGLCSQGRFHPKDRRQVSWTGAKALKETWFRLLSLHISDPSKLICSMACRRLSESPFPPSLIQEARQAWIKVLLEQSLLTAEELMEVRDYQTFYLKAISETLRLMDDPDYRVFHGSPNESFTLGVSLGPGTKLPRTPAVFERKSRWKNYDETQEIQDNSNYLSAAAPGMDKILETQFQEEEKLGMMLHTNYYEASLEYNDDNLRIASLASIEKDDNSFRVLFDGTHGTRINNRTKVRDQLRMPTAGDQRCIMEVSHRDAPGVHFGIQGGVSKAHRRFVHKQKDWGMLGCRTGARPDLPTGPYTAAHLSSIKTIRLRDKIWLNRVGTFGTGCAGYWWGRLAAGLGRMVVGFLDVEWVFQLIYADDLRVQAHGPRRNWIILLAYMIWEMAGTPFSWRKFGGGLQSDWVGYYLDYCRFAIGISESRSIWLQEWGRRIISDGVVLISRMASGLGRLGFSAGILEWCRPFLAPMYAWCSVAPPHSVLPVPPLIKLTLSWIIQQLHEGNRMTDCTLPSSDLGELFRTDAKGETDYIVLGGWESRNSTPPSKARWFSVKVTKEEAPWLFQRGHGSRTIASSELLGTLVAVFLFCSGPDFAPGPGRMTCSGATDNQRNQYVVQRLMTTKWPLAAVLMELTSLLSSKGLWLNLDWTPRTDNIEADQLTNEVFTSFDLSLRMDFQWKDVPSTVMTSLLERGETFLEELEGRRASRKAQFKSTAIGFRKRRKIKTIWAAGEP